MVTVVSDLEDSRAREELQSNLQEGSSFPGSKPSKKSLNVAKSSLRSAIDSTLKIILHWQWESMLLGKLTCAILWQVTVMILTQTDLTSGVFVCRHSQRFHSASCQEDEESCIFLQYIVL